MVFWPEQDCYSEVSEGKIAEPKSPKAGDVCKVKEGSKMYSGKVVAAGTKSEIFFYFYNTLSGLPPL